MLKVGIVDDHRLFRKSLMLLVSTFQNVEPVLEADNGLELLEKLESTAVDLLLLDIQMPQMDGYQACTEIRTLYPDIKILIVSQFTTKEAIHKVMDLGAHGFFSKNANPEQLEDAINHLNDRDFYFGQGINSVIKEALIWERTKKNEQAIPQINISAREIEVIKLACKEYSSSEIADKLCITPRTVDSHRKRVMERTNSKNFIGVILFAIKHGLVPLEDL